jgi:hypothetical protein
MVVASVEHQPPTNATERPRVEVEVKSYDGC